MKKIPKISFVSTYETEVERVLYTAASIVDGFYRRKGFAVLPELEGYGKVGQVILPDLKYGKLEQFWQRLRGVDSTFPLDVEESLKDGVSELCGELKATNVSAWKSQWAQVESDFWRLMGEWLLDECELVGEVEVRVTAFGTVSSYSHLSKKIGQKLIVYVREDVGLAGLAEILLTALMYQRKKQGRYKWIELEAVVDFILTSPRMKKIFPKYESTLLGVSAAMRYRGKSEKYLKKLGVVYVHEGLELLGKGIYLDGRSVERKLSSQEKKLLRLFLAAGGELVSFDSVADTLWGEGEFVSLYALNKSVQRLRGKLDKLGSDGKLLKTLRKRGYVWEG